MSGGKVQIDGQLEVVPLSLTADETTTEELVLAGKAFGTLTNYSGGDITVTYYHKPTASSTPAEYGDEDGFAPITQTIPNGKSRQIKSAAAGCNILCLKLASGTADVIATIKR